MQIIQLKKITKWLNKPFPFYENYKQKVLVPSVFTFLVMVGIIILNYNENTDIFILQIQNVLSYGVVIIVVSLFLSIALPEIFPEILNVETWTVKKTILYFFSSIIIIATFVSIYAYQYKNPNNLSFNYYFVLILKRSIILSFFPILIIVFYAEKKLYKQNHLRAVKIINELKEQKENNNEINNNDSITFAKNTNEELSINENKLLYIKAEGNYCLIVFEEKAVSKEKLIRSSLKNIEHIINKPEIFIRCHKSYIVNKYKITNVTGNAKGYMFTIKDNLNKKIPISRNFSKLLLQKIKKIYKNNDFFPFRNFSSPFVTYCLIA